MDQDLKDLCWEVLKDNVHSDRFMDLILKTGLELRDEQWDVANRLLIKQDEIRHSLGKNKEMVH